MRIAKSQKKANVMRERPILFSGPMVRAILEGRKTQTRRVVKPQPVTVGDKVEAVMRYRIGDRLWVRETWCAGYKYEDDCPVLDENGEMVEAVFYRATEPELRWYEDGHEVNPPWKPSIHMPRTASRITLEITAVRVERLQDISRGDCMAEGCPFPNLASQTDPVGWYADLWRTLNGPESWQANPWVWVIEFKRVEA